MRTITLKLPDHLADRLDQSAAAAKTTRSALVRAALEKSLGDGKTENGSCFDLAGDLMGSIKGLPADLATNPIHMEGFGG
jgi:metal-responsive CopG/Arc/MetJ family transcriptional regulator